jgi:hypothetical protein
VEASYVGNQSRNGVVVGNWANPNNIPPGAFFGPNPLTGQVIPITQANFPTNNYRPLQSYGDINLVTHGSYANYNSLQLTAQKQAGAITFVTNYTFGKVLGIRDNYSGNGASSGNTVWPFNINANYGVLAYDHTHIFNAAYIINLPKPVHGNAFLAGAINGWIISGVTQFQSGAPIQPNTNGNLNASYGNTTINGSTIGISTQSYLGSNAANLHLMPLLTCDPRSGLRSGQYFNPGCFAAPPVGTQGPLVWPYIKGPGFFDSDLALYKSFRITESQRVEFRVSAFNFLNRPNPGFVISGNTSDTTLNFGAPFSTNTNPLTTGRPLYATGDRLIELALKYYF